MIRLIWQKGGEQNEQEAETSDRRGRKSPEEDLRAAGLCEGAPGSEEEGSTEALASYIVLCHPVPDGYPHRYMGTDTVHDEYRGTWKDELG